MFKCNKKIWSIGAEIFVPAAASRLLSQNQLDQMINSGLEVISSGANVPFADKEIFFGPIAKKADSMISLIPDFISNCGMARVFAYLMEDRRIDLTDEGIFQDCSNVIYNALMECYSLNASATNITSRALEIALKNLLS